MTGLEKIVDQILAEAKAEAQRILDEANIKAQEIAAEAEAQAENTVLDVQKNTEARKAILEQRMHSANDLYRRTQTLFAKQEMIAKVISMAYDRVCGMDAEAYFGMLEKMLQKYVLAQPGEIWFSAKDLAAMPADFPEKIQAAARAVGGELTLSPTGKDVENGFILVYGGVEENCTIKAIFEARRDEMQDTVHALLYGKEA